MKPLICLLLAVAVAGCDNTTYYSEWNKAEEVCINNKGAIKVTSNIMITTIKVKCANGAVFEEVKL